MPTWRYWHGSSDSDCTIAVAYLFYSLLFPCVHWTRHMHISLGESLVRALSLSFMDYIWLQSCVRGLYLDRQFFQPEIEHLHHHKQIVTLKLHSW